MIVVDQPRYKFLRTPSPFSFFKISLRVSQEECDAWVCDLCLTTSAGTLTMQAAISPIEEENICVTTSATLLDGSNPLKKPRVSALQVSYVIKNSDAPGAEATTALPRPRYTPRYPPFLKNPPLACNLVFKVSIGKNTRSVEVPAAAPLSNDIRNPFSIATLVSSLQLRDEHPQCSLTAQF